MPNHLSIPALLKCLKGMGLVVVQLGRDEHSCCWRIRTQGGPLVRIFDNGDIVFSGAKARVVRKSLGLQGNFSVRFSEEAPPQEVFLGFVGKIDRGGEQ